jgi:hypothetical protein
MALLTVAIAANTGATSKPARVLTLRDYGTTIVHYSDNEDYNALYEEVVNLTGSVVERVEDVFESLMDAGESDIRNYHTKFIIGADFTDFGSKGAEFTDFSSIGLTKAMYATTAIHSAPISVNLVHNALMKRLFKDLHITVVNHPLPSREVSVL